jgi:hypothetical protein
MGFEPLARPTAREALGIADALRELAVGNGFAVRDCDEFGPDFLLEGRALGREEEIEGFKFSGEVGAELADEFAQGSFVFVPRGIRGCRFASVGERDESQS